jgi:hypothetical protein
MVKKNCWEFMQCGREPGGALVDEFGVCPAAIIQVLDGFNNGKYGGRACWALGGTMCFGAVQGTFARKISNCLYCEFFKLVHQEEGGNLVSTKDILKKIQEG